MRNAFKLAAYRLDPAPSEPTWNHVQAGDVRSTRSRVINCHIWMPFFLIIQERLKTDFANKIRHFVSSSGLFSHALVSSDLQLLGLSCALTYIILHWQFYRVLDTTAPKQSHIGSVANVPQLHSINEDIILRQEAPVRLGAELFVDALVSFLYFLAQSDLGGWLNSC
jgi:hypothetical protein